MDETGAPMTKPLRKTSFWTRTQRIMLTGILTLIPLWITWIIFKFVLEQLSNIGKPAAGVLTTWLNTNIGFLSQEDVETILGVILTLLLIYIVGWAATKFFGRRLLDLFDTVVQSIPLVEKIYGATKKLLSALQQKPDGVQRVVLIEFPNENMKAVGFVTRTLTDEDTGELIAAVYVPTTPNPTSGYLELVPLDRVTSTDWNMDEAMSFIISGGAVSRRGINFRKSRGEPITLDDAMNPPVDPPSDHPEERKK